WLQAIRPTIAPSGNGSLPSRYALMAMSFPRTARISLRSPASWATETTFQSRYPDGISFTKIGAASLSESAANVTKAATPASIATATSDRVIRFVNRPRRALAPEVTSVFIFTFRFEIFVCSSSADANNSEISDWNGQATHFSAAWLKRRLTIQRRRLGIAQRPEARSHVF